MKTRITETLRTFVRSVLKEDTCPCGIERADCDYHKSPLNGSSNDQQEFLTFDASPAYSKTRRLMRKVANALKNSNGLVNDEVLDVAEEASNAARGGNAGFAEVSEVIDFYGWICDQEGRTLTIFDPQKGYFS